MSKEELLNMEKHLVPVLIVILIGLGGWNLKATNQLQADQRSNYQEFTGKMNLQFAQLDFLKQNFSTRTLDRYTGSDAGRDKAQLMGEINMLHLKYTALKSSIADLKNRNSDDSN
jgi:hypothetical protein